MKTITRQQLADLTCKLDEFVETELGMNLPFIALIATPSGGLMVFSNRRSNEDAKVILKAALEAVEEHSDAFIDIDEEQMNG